MRLTDILRDKDRKKKQASAPLSESSELSSQEVTSEIKPKHVAGHLNADDLAAMYNIGTPAQDFGVSAASGKDAGAGEREAVSQAGLESSESDFKSRVSRGDIPGSPGEGARESTQEGEEGDAGIQKAHIVRRSGDENYENMEELELADALHIELLSLLSDVYDEGKRGGEIYIERLIGPITQTIDLCKTSNAILRKAVRLKKGGGSFTAHSLNVAIIALKIGLSRAYSDERVFSLALCALLGDIGMTRVEPSILNKSGKLTPEEFMEIKRHIEYSVEIVKSISNKFPFLAPIIYQIHERENGSGYPQGLTGANIHEFAKITGMSDVYIALTEAKANRENYSGYVAMQQIISRRGIDFDAKVIKSLIDVISVFPLESLVKLNTGTIGRIIDISPVHPTRPKLSVLINSDGEKLKRPEFLDLEEEPLLYIEGPDIEEGVIL